MNVRVVETALYLVGKERKNHLQQHLNRKLMSFKYRDPSDNGCETARRSGSNINLRITYDVRAFTVVMHHRGATPGRLFLCPSHQRQYVRGCYHWD